MKFADDQHKAKYIEFCNRMEHLDSYHKAAAYILALDNSLREHPDAVFDFNGDQIKPEGLHAAFQTGTSLKSSRLLYNLWNGYTADAEDDSDSPARYTPDEIFACSYMLYYLEAVRIRFESFE